MKRFFLLFMSIFLLGFMTQSYGRPIFNITTSENTIQMALGSTRNVSFTVTNATNRSSSDLSIYLTTAPHASLASGNTCTGQLAANSSCLLALTVQAPNQVTSFKLIPKICGFGGLACSIPATNNIVNVQVTNTVTSDIVYLPVIIVDNVSAVVNSINTSNDAVSTAFTLPSSGGIATQVTPNGKKVYTLVQDGLYVYNTDTGISSTISIPDSGETMAMSPDGSKIYLTAEVGGSRKIHVVSTLTDTVTAIINFDGLRFTFSPNGATAYATERGASGLAVINTVTSTITTIINLPASGAGLAVTPDGTELYVGDFSDNLNIISTSSNTILSTNPFSSTPNLLAFTPDGSKLYVVQTTGSTLRVVNPNTLAVTKTLSLGTGNINDTVTGLVITPNGQKVYVSGGPFGGSNPIGFVDDISTATDTITNLMQMGTQAFSMGVTNLSAS